MILGAVAIVRPFRVDESLVRRDALAMGATTVLALVFLANYRISRLEGVVLCGLLVAYVVWLATAARGESEGPAPSTDRSATESDADLDFDPAGASVRSSSDSPASAFGREVRWLDVPLLLVGLALVVLGGRLLVDTATELAAAAGVSEWVIGTTVVAAGTSVPELATSLVAARRGELAIAAGNVVGSNVFNVLGVLGVAAIVRPMTVATDALTGLVWLLVPTATATALLATERRLTRLEGAALAGFVGLYWATGFIL